MTTRASRLVLFMILMGGAAPKVSAQDSVPASVRTGIVAQLFRDTKELVDCLKDQGKKAQDQFAAELQIEAIDLNRDGKPEYSLQPSGSCSCGAHNCSLWIYEPVAGGYALIFESAGIGMSLEKTMTNGYADLSVDAHNNAATRFSTYYKFDGKKYAAHHTDFIDMETGEVKPAEIRVRFKRGAHSTTVKGKASPGFPDTYRVGAQAGQMMSVQLTAPKKSVVVMIMGPGYESLADQVTMWTGALPASGDYLITVDAVQGKMTYTMTISIK